MLVPDAFVVHVSFPKFSRDLMIFCLIQIVLTSFWSCSHKTRGRSVVSLEYPRHALTTSILFPRP